MASYIKTLKEDNGDITYPQTKGSAVLLDGGSDLESVLAAKADASTVNQKITVGDVQSTDIVANAVTTAKIADNAVTSDKIDWATIMQSGEWVLVDSASLSSNTSGTTFLNVAVPTEFQGANVEYKLTIGAEFLASQFSSYPYLNCRKSNGNWDHNDKDFSYIRTAQVGNTAPNVYTATKVNPMAFEWVITTNNCSCTAEVIVGRAGTGNYWNAIGRAGGYSDGGASSVSLAARTQWAASISGFRIECATTITLLAGSHMSLWARKTNVKH